MSEVATIIAALVEFRDARNWKQFHNTKDLALALSVEAAELNELFLWKGPEDVDPNRLEEELADVLIYAMLLLEKHGLSLSEIVLRKLAKNAERYPPVPAPEGKFEGKQS